MKYIKTYLNAMILGIGIINNVYGYDTDMDIRNGCMVKSVEYMDYLTSYVGKQVVDAQKDLTKYSDRWCKILIVEYRGETDFKKPLCHAVCVFEINNSIWVYDPNIGSFDLKTDSKDCNELENIWNSIINKDRTVYYCEYVDGSTNSLISNVVNNSKPICSNKTIP